MAEGSRDEAAAPNQQQLGRAAVHGERRRKQRDVTVGREQSRRAACRRLAWKLFGRLFGKIDSSIICKMDVRDEISYMPVDFFSTFFFSNPFYPYPLLLDT